MKSIWFWSPPRPRVPLYSGLKSFRVLGPHQSFEEHESLEVPSYVSFASHDLKLKACTDSADAQISRRKFASQKTRSVAGGPVAGVQRQTAPPNGRAPMGVIERRSWCNPRISQGGIKDDDACGRLCIRMSFIWSTFWAFCNEDGRYIYGEFAGQPRFENHPLSQKVVVACHFSSLGQDRKCRTAWLPWCRIRPLMPSLDLWWSPMLFSSEPGWKIRMFFPSAQTLDKQNVWPWLTMFVLNISFNIFLI